MNEDFFGNTESADRIRNIKNYPGGKGSPGTYQTIINEIRPTQILIIPFLGNCAITRYIKKPEKIIAIDKDERVIKVWQDRNICSILICADAISLLPEIIIKYAGTSSGRITIYCDPPYLIDTRKTKKRIYKYEMSKEDHSSLLKLIRSIKGIDILISCYPNDLYSVMLKDWRLVEYKTNTRQGRVKEFLYCNFENKDGVLHDYRYLGNNFRQREWIRNKIKRLKRKLESLPIKERNALIDSITNVR